MTVSEGIKRKSDLTQQISDLCTTSRCTEAEIYEAIRTNELMRRPVGKMFDSQLDPRRRMKTTPGPTDSKRKPRREPSPTSPFFWAFGVCFGLFGAILISMSIAGPPGLLATVEMMIGATFIVGGVSLVYFTIGGDSK